MIGAKNVIKSESNLVKKSLFRRGAALYTAMKRMKGGKKPRQISTRRTLNKQCANDEKNNAIICTISSEGGANKPFLKTIDRYRPNKSNIGYDRVVEPPCLNAYAYVNNNKKLTATNNLTKTNTSGEETAVVRHGAKRMKIVSANASKALLDVGESSCTVDKTNAKMSSRIPHACNKQNIKGTCNRARKYCRLPAKQMKSDGLKETKKKSSKGNPIFEGNAKENS